MDGSCFYTKGMLPHKKSKKFRNKSPIREKYKAVISDQELKNGSNQTEDTLKKLCDILDMSDSVSSCQMLCLPEKVDEIANHVTELKITNNDFSELHQLLGPHGNLQNLIHDNISQPRQSLIGQILNLRILNLSNNEIEELPDNLSYLRNLEILNLSGNKLESLPLCYANLQRLRDLNISGNKFKVLPNCIANGMGTLRTLDISQNQCIKMNIIPCSKYLEKFYAKNNGNCSKFPDWLVIQKFYNLKEFNLDGTKFDIYSFVGKEGDVNVQSVSMANSNLSNVVLDMMIENMVNLKEIHVHNENVFNSGNVFNELPIKILKSPEKITELNFQATGLSMISNAITQLCNLKKLDVGTNCISWLPEDFCQLQKLESLTIDNNGLIMLPENIGDMKSLRVLRAAHNSLRHLPESFKNLKNLKYVDLYNNVVEEFPDIFYEMENLEGLDIEQNHFETDDIMIGGTSYTVLQKNFASYLETNAITHLDSRNLGSKRAPSIKSDSSYKNVSSYSISQYSDEEMEDNIEFVKSEDENWDTPSDTDDDFNPTDPKIINYAVRTKSYIPPKLEGFCPADLHSLRIKAEVSSMRAYGSLPSFTITEGQFDDA